MVAYRRTLSPPDVWLVFQYRRLPRTPPNVAAISPGVSVMLSGLVVRVIPFIVLRVLVESLYDKAPVLALTHNSPAAISLHRDDESVHHFQSGARFDSDDTRAEDAKSGRWAASARNKRDVVPGVAACLYHQIAERVKGVDP